MSEREHHLTAMTESWARLTGNAMEAAMTANTAALDAIARVIATTDADDRASRADSTADADDHAPETVPAPERRAGSVAGVLYESENWTVERSVSAGGLAVGDTIAFEKTITDDDVRAFASVSGDTNRLHLDDEYAGETQFGGRIAHGGLVSALVSAALARLPGVVIYLSQELSYLGPVGVGDRPRATVEVVEAVGGGRHRLETVVETDGETVVDGEAVVLVESPEDD